jgi:hypothetical protein
MAGYTQAYQQDTLDRNHPTTGNTDYIAYSTNGTSEAAIIARTAIGSTGWAAATAATPSVKANNAALTSAAASGSGTVTHFAIYSASTSGVQKTDWQALSASRAVVSGDTLQWAIGSVTITLD